MNPAATPDGGTAVRLLCWVVILGMAAIEIFANVARSAPPTPTTHPAIIQASDPPAADDNASIAVGGRYAVAVHSSGISAGPELMSSIIEQMQKQSVSPTDRIDLAIVSQEVEPAAQFQARLNALQTEANLSPADANTIDALKQIDAGGVDSLAKSQRTLLVDRLGWFGRLALVHGLSETDPLRRKLIGGTHRILLVIGAGAFVLVTSILVGIGLLITAIVLGATHKIVLRFRAAPAGSAYLEIFALYMLGFLAVSLVIHLFSASPGLGWTLIATLVLVPVALFWPVIRGETWPTVREDLGWHRGQGILIEMACGIGAYVASLPLFALAFGITNLLIKLADRQHWIGASPSHPILHYLTGPPDQLLMIYVLASVCAPLLEETMFRGALFQHLRGRHRWWVSALIVSVLFAAIHPQGWTLIPTLGALAMSFAAMREWRGSLIPSMTAHALNNGVVLTLAILLMR